jgi:O-antigen ligase
MLQKGLGIWMNHPLLGVGPGQFYRSYYSQSAFFNQNTHGLVAHNMYVEFLAEFGVIGALAVFSVFYIALIRLLRLDATAIQEGGGGRYVGFGYALGLFAMLLMSFTLSQGYNSVFWFIVGMGLSAKRWASTVK